MHYRNIGKTDVMVSTVTMGCWAIVGDFNWGPQDEDDAVAAIRSALELGINTFDTAEAYGSGYSEKLLGKVLEGRRKDVVIATKASPSNFAPKKLRRACEDSLKRLNTDYIDIYQLHWPNHEVPVDDTLGAMDRLREEGKIRVAGCSNFGPGDVSEALAAGRLESNQVAYNLLWRGLEYELQQICVENEVSLLPYSPLAQGLLTGKFRTPEDVPPERARTRHFAAERPHTRHGEEGAEEETFEAIKKIEEISEGLGKPMAQVALAYLIARPGVASVIAGMRNAKQAAENSRAADVELSEGDIKKLDIATGPLKKRFGPALDMWQSEERTK